MLRASCPTPQTHRTRAALEWASTHDVLEEKQIKFRRLIPILETLPLDRALPILQETYSPDHGRPAYDPLLLFRTEFARRVLRVDSRDPFAAEILAPDPTLRLLLGYAADGPVPCAQTLRRFEHRICPSRKRSVRMPNKRSRSHPGKDPTARAARVLLRHQGHPIPVRTASAVDRLLRVVGFEPGRRPHRRRHLPPKPHPWPGPQGLHPRPHRMRVRRDLHRPARPPRLRSP